MHCGKCGMEIPEGSTFCNSCGTRTSGEMGKKLPGWAVANLGTVLVVVGSVMLMVGGFLPWVRSDWDFLGINVGNGAVAVVAGVLSLAALMVAPRGVARRWGAVVVLLGALSVAGISQALYNLEDNDVSIGYGLYVCMAGALAVVAGGLIALTTREE